jgi:16S rRNA (guanine(966)-N(2))-methyltransferase RsmD
MRVGGGREKGKVLRYPRKGLRPTKNVVRQAILNILRPRLPGARVCDLFCGAGALGIEALSAGAEAGVFIEQDFQTVRYLKANLRGMGTPPVFGAKTGSVPSRFKVITGNVLNVLPRLTGTRFDVIMADPPYEQGLDQATLDGIAGYGLLADDGILILEHSRRDQATIPAGLELVNQHKFGDTRVSVFRPRGWGHHQFSGRKQVASPVRARGKAQTTR